MFAAQLSLRGKSVPLPSWAVDATLGPHDFVRKVSKTFLTFDEFCRRMICAQEMLQLPAIVSGSR